MQGSSDRKTTVVLVVEDEMMVRMFAIDALQEAGFHLVEARDGVEALAVLELRDDVAVVFTDISMHNMNGITLAKVVSQRWPDIAIIITSGALPPGMQLDMPAGARFLPKPYTAERLMREIETALPALTATPVVLNSLPNLQPGKTHGAGGLAQPLQEPEK
jgi:two-component system, response regulator PdtaR